MQLKIQVEKKHYLWILQKTEVAAGRFTSIAATVCRLEEAEEEEEEEAHWFCKRKNAIFKSL